jgi:site-specific DNA-cytosine methylase
MKTKSKRKREHFVLGANEQTINLPEIEIRYVQPPLTWNEKIVSAEGSVKALRSVFEPGEIGTQEQFIVLYLNRQNKIKGYYKHTKGGINSTIVDIRPILAIALKTLSVGIIVCHNHPSGATEPSSEDLAITRKLKEAARLMDISLMDHVILTEDSYYSMSNEGLVGTKGKTVKPENEIVLLDLFSGIGGFAKGLEEAGYKITKHYFSEVNKYSTANYKHNFKNATHIGDIEKVKGKSIQRPDIITFGSPCQDLSLAGNRKGLKGKRSGLFFEAIRLIKETKPRFFIFENVKGLLSSNKGKDFEDVLKAFAELGLYNCQWQLLNTRWFLPQHRERLYLVGSLTKEPTPEVFPIGAADPFSPESIEETGTEGEVSNTITSTIGACGFHTPFIVYSDKKGKGKSLYHNTLRKFTPVECERLQGFPDDWTASGIFEGKKKDISDAQRYIMLGNAVSVPVVKEIGERLLGKVKVNEFEWLEKQLNNFKAVA